MTDQLDDIDFNELVIVARHEGQVSAWKAWKREIGAFHDPRLWRDTQAYDQYFTRLDGDAWAMAGYGVIVMDLDHKTAWSFNDYSAPWSLFLPNPHSFDSNPKEPKWWHALFAAPQAWGDYKIDLARTGGLIKMSRKTLSLADLLGEERDPKRCMDKITAQRGEIEHNGKTYVVLGGRHVPADWQVGCEIGKDDPEGLLTAMTTWQATGFPPPASWDAIDEFMSGHGDIPVSDEAFATFLNEIDNEIPELQDEAREAYEIAKRYRELRQAWTGGSVRARLKP